MQWGEVRQVWLIYQELVSPRGMTEGLGSPRVWEVPLGTPSPSLPRKSSEDLRAGPENLGSRRSRRLKIMNPSNNDYWVVRLIQIEGCASNLTRLGTTHGDSLEKLQRAQTTEIK